MMPWEHALVGYIGFSAFVHAVYREPPTSKETAVVVFAALLPDLVDKPLAWGLGVFTSGYGIAHSVFLVAPASIAVGWLAWSRGHPRLGIALALGWFLHLVGDLSSKFLTDGETQFARVLWPVRRTGDGYETGFVEEFGSNVLEYFHWMSRQMASDNPDPYLFVVLGIGIGGALLWVYDGMPIGRDAVRAVRRSTSKFARLFRD